MRCPSVRVDNTRAPMGHGAGLFSRNRQPGASNNLGDASKGIDQQVSEQLTDADLRETIGLECVKHFLAKHEYIMAASRTLAEERKKMEQEKQQEANRWRKSGENGRHRGNWDAWDEAAEMERLEKLAMLSRMTRHQSLWMKMLMSGVSECKTMPNVDGSDVASVTDPVVISSDDNDGNDKNVVDDVDLHEIGMAVAQSI